jgi:hypothetical protein
MGLWKIVFDIKHLRKKQEKKKKTNTFKQIEIKYHRKDTSLSNNPITCLG